MAGQNQVRLWLFNLVDSSWQWAAPEATLYISPAEEVVALTVGAARLWTASHGGTLPSVSTGMCSPGRSSMDDPEEKLGLWLELKASSTLRSASGARICRSR